MTSSDVIALARRQTAAHYERLALLAQVKSMVAQAQGGSAAVRLMLMQPGFLTCKQAQ